MSVTPNSIITPQTPKASGGVAITGNNNYSAPGNAVVIFTAGPNGARVTTVSALTQATCAATELQLYRDYDGSGTNKRFLRSRLMPAYTVAQTTGQPEIDFTYSDALPLILAPNEKLYGAIGVNNTGIVFNVEGADY